MKVNYDSENKKHLGEYLEICNLKSSIALAFLLFF